MPPKDPPIPRPDPRRQAQQAFPQEEAKPPPKKCCDRCLSLEEAKQMVKENNRSKHFSDELVLCLIWKETNFCPQKKAKTSTATGLTQMTKGAVTDVNKAAPKDEQFTHAQMTDGPTAIRAGTRYMDLRRKWAGGNETKALNGYGTGAGYSDNIVACEACMKSSPGQSCLNKIHT